MMLQLDPPIPVRVPPDLDALARVLIDRGPGTHLEWTCQVLEGPFKNTSWTFPNPQVRFNTSLTDGWLEMLPFSEADVEQWQFLDPDDDGEGRPDE